MIWSWLVAKLGTLLTRMLVAIVIVLVGFVLGKLAGRLAYQFFHEIELNKFVKRLNIKFRAEESLSQIIEFIIHVVAIIVAIDQLGLTATILYFISGIVILLLIAAFFLGVKDFIQNMISGFVAFRKGKIKPGDIVSVEGIAGTIIRAGLLETKIRNKSGDEIFIPNSLFYKKIVTIRRH